MVLPPSPSSSPYFSRMASTLARGGVHSTKATVSEMSRTRICVGPSMTAEERGGKRAPVILGEMGGDSKLQGCFHMTFKAAGISVWGHGQET